MSGCVTVTQRHQSTGTNALLNISQRCASPPPGPSFILPSSATVQHGRLTSCPVTTGYRWGRRLQGPPTTQEEEEAWSPHFNPSYGQPVHCPQRTNQLTGGQMSSAKQWPLTNST